MTSLTGSLAVDIASDKELTNRLLAAAGLPVPASEVVRTATGRGPDRASDRLPVVVKPLDGNHGRGVAINLTTDDEVSAAFDEAHDESRRGYVLVESFITGRGLPGAGGRRQHGRDRRAGAGSRDRRRHPHRRRTGGHHQRRPAARCRAREGADPDRRHRRRRRAGARPGLRDGLGPAGRRDGQTRPDRQHVHRRHLHRPDLRGAPGQRRHRRGGRPRRRAGHRRHRLPLSGHHPAGARDRRRDLRGQRRARLPDALPPDHRRPAVRGETRGGPDVPARDRPRGSRSSRSPAPTARRRRPG